MSGFFDDIFGGGDSQPPPAPSFAPVQAASDKASQLGYDAATNDLNFRKQVYQDSQPRQQALYDLATQVANKQIGIMDDSQKQAAAQWDSYNKTWKPNEQQTLADSYGSQYLNDEDNAGLSKLLSGGAGLNTGDTQLALSKYGRKAEDTAGSDAAARAEGQANAVFGQTTRNLARYGGGDPDRMVALAAQQANAQTLASVNASNTARTGVREKMAGMRAGAANFGRNLPNTAATSYGLAGAVGSQGVNSQNTGFMSSLPYAQFQAGGYGTQLGAAGMGGQQALGMGGLMNQQYGHQINAWGQQQQADATSMAGLGQFAGMAMSAGSGTPWWLASDRRLKSDIVRVGTHRFGIGIYEFTIGGARQRGVMADEVEQVLPRAVRTVAGYKQVNYAELE